MKRIQFLVLVLMQATNVTIAQAQQWTVYNTINSGIPSNEVRTIAIDDADNVWIGSSSGIAEFDNSNWTVFSSYSHAYYQNGIALDTAGSIWLAPNNGVNTICGVATDTCYAYDIPFGPTLSTYWSYVIAIDANDHAWLGGGPIESGRILEFDHGSWTEHYATSAMAFSIAIDAAQNVWVGGGGSLDKFDGNSWTHYSIPGSGNNLVNSIAIDANDSIWLATSNGLTKFDGSLTTYNTSNSDIPSNIVRTVAIDDIGNKWVGTDYGLAKFDGTNWTVYTTSNSGLPSNDISTVAIDGNGKVWIGTMDEGLVVFDASSTSIEENSINGKSVSLSPNPASETVLIQTNSAQIELIDILGKRHASISVKSGQVDLDVSMLSDGIYFVRTDSGAATKLIVRHQ